MAYEKKFIIPDEKIKPILSGRGTCRIPDTLLVLGKKLYTFYRVMPTEYSDSGWRFFSGTESDEYLARPEFYGTYDLNIAANYFPSVIPLLDSPPYSAYCFDKERRKWADISLSMNWTDLE